MSPLKVYQKGNKKTNSLIKSDGKLNYRELTFLSGSAWKHITEMPAKVFLELTLKVVLITSGYSMACSESEIKLVSKLYPELETVAVQKFCTKSKNEITEENITSD